MEEAEVPSIGNTSSSTVDSDGTSGSTPSLQDPLDSNLMEETEEVESVGSTSSSAVENGNTSVSTPSSQDLLEKSVGCQSKSDNSIIEETASDAITSSKPVVEDNASSTAYFQKSSVEKVDQNDEQTIHVEPVVDVECSPVVNINLSTEKLPSHRSESMPVAVVSQEGSSQNESNNEQHANEITSLLPSLIPTFQHSPDSGCSSDTIIEPDLLHVLKRRSNEGSTAADDQTTGVKRQKCDGSFEDSDGLQTSIIDPFENNINLFERVYMGSFNARVRLANEGKCSISASAYVQPGEVLATITDSLAKQDKLVVKRRKFFSDLARQLVERAAMSSVYFLAFIRDKIDGFKNASVSDIIEMLHTKKTEDHGLANLIVQFYEVYAWLPSSKQNRVKNYLCRGIEARASLKEASTMNTVIRGLVNFLILIGVVSNLHGSKKNVIYNEIWSAATISERKLSKIRGRGALKERKFSMSLIDLVELQLASDTGAKSPVELQSWLYGLFLAGVGIRATSVTSMRLKDLMTPKIITIGDRDCEDEKEGEHSANNNNNSNNSYSDSDKFAEETEGNDGCFIFHKLMASNIKIYRVAAREGDPSIRLRAEVHFRNDVVTGSTEFKIPSCILHHPAPLVEGKEDWSPGVVLALVLLSIRAGIVNPEDVYKMEAGPGAGVKEVLISKTDVDNSSDVSLFRANAKGIPHYSLSDKALEYHSSVVDTLLRSLKLPSNAYSLSKSFRYGFADHIHTCTALRIAPYELIGNFRMQDALLKAGRWKNNEVDNYLKQTLQYTDLCGTNVTKRTSSDWMRSRYRSLAFAKIKQGEYHYYNSLDAKKELLKQMINSGTPEEEAENEVYSWTSRMVAEQAQLLSYISFDKALSHSTSDEDIRRFFLNRPVVDVKQAVLDYCKMNDLVGRGTAFKEILGNFYACNIVGAFKCPIVSCEEIFVDASEANIHWKQHVASDTYLDECYLCPCKVGEKRSFHSHIGHIRSNHYDKEIEPGSFKWTVLSR